MAKREINRIRVVLAEKSIANKWLAEKLQKNPTTISRWCSNEMQPSLETLIQISDALEVDIRQLLNSTEKRNG